MLTSSVRPLILSYGAAIAFFDLAVLLPGNPDVTGVGGLLIMVAVQALIVWRLLHRSLIAWSLAVLASGSYTVSFVFIGGPYETVFTISALLALVQVGFLFTPPVLAHVFGRDSRPAH